tara:strand:- start:383129 stop:383650 length:522 start_codon:yes stop_codon:yes gene_type:complete
MKLKGTTAVPNVFFDSIMATLTGSAIRVYLKIIRNTLGWRDENGNVKKRDWISHSQFEKVGLSNRSVTSAIEELLREELILATDYLGNNLNDPVKRKKAKRVFYSIVFDNPEKIALTTEKNDKTKPQNLRTTKEISLQKEYGINEKIPDHLRINQIKDQEQRKQIQRDGWLYN